MFTGLIEYSGVVASVEQSADGAIIAFETPLAATLKPGDSVAVNGVCLTAKQPSASGFSADVMNETLSRTALGTLAPGDQVNLERPLAIGDRLDGHIVQGHVDAVGKVADVREAGFARIMRVVLPSGLARYVVAQGSITIDGVSLTVSAVNGDWLEVSLIPETRERTNLGEKATGDPVNLEVDVLAKYVERQISHRSCPPNDPPPNEPTNG